MSDNLNEPKSDGEGAPHLVTNDRVDERNEQSSAPLESSVEEGSWRPKRSKWWANVLFALLILAGAIIVLRAWGSGPFASTIVETDNAYVRGQVTVLAPQVNGYVSEVLVQDFQRVRAGQPLVRIDDRVARQRVAQAQANLAAQTANLNNSQQSQRSAQAGIAGQSAALVNANAQLARARADLRRTTDLVRDGSVSRREHDQAIAAVKQAEAGVGQAQAQRTVAQEQARTAVVGKGGLEAATENARAALRLAEIELENTVVRAPRDGQLGEVNVRSGQLVTAGTQLMALVPNDLWVVANFRENQVANIRQGQQVVFSVDALGGAELTGIVERLAPAAGSEFSVIRPETGTGTFVKVPQRIAVRVRINPGQPLALRLAPGMSVYARIDTGQKSTAERSR